MEEGIKVALAYKHEQNKKCVTKVWRFYTWALKSYTLAQVKEELLEHFPEIAAKHLTLNLNYCDSFMEMISIDTDKELKVDSLIPEYI